jgi:hypothetical protein
MLRKFNLFCGGNDNHADYLPVAVAAPVADATTAFNQLPTEILMMIAGKLPVSDLIPFFLTNKKTLSFFENFEGNARQYGLQATIKLRNGSETPLPFSQVNHLLMAQYFINIELANQEELHEDYNRRECRQFAACVTAGVLVGAAIHVGGAVLCDQIILPRCVDCCLGTCGPAACSPFGCGGQVCLDHIPYLGFTRIGHHMVADLFASIASYRVLNVLCCYVSGPLPCSFGIGMIPPCTYNCRPSRDHQYMLIEEGISERLRSFKTNHGEVNEIAVRNASLREAKRGKYVHMFLTASRPISIKMEEQQNHHISQQMDAPAVLRME